MDLETFSRTTARILDELEKVIVGKRPFLQKVLCAFLADGHVLIEDFPGLAKTLTARSLAAVLGLSFKRIQFTPDLLPADITGGYVFNRQSGAFELVKGPLFANVVIGDEINRAPPKTQAAMLEAMEERQVSLDGESHLLPSPFFVIATQNPIEYEGTFPLPEAQLDRFLVRLSIGYPSAEEELEMLARRRAQGSDIRTLATVTDVSEILQMRAFAEEVTVDDDVERYMIALVHGTRDSSHLAVGASPRASLGLLKLSRVLAAMRGRRYVIPDDVKDLALDVLVHRLMLKPDMWAMELSTKRVAESIVQATPVPKIGDL